MDQHDVPSGQNRSWEIRAIADRPPTVALEAPKANLYVTPTAIVPIQATVSDDMAIHEIYVHSVHYQKTQNEFHGEGYEVKVFAGIAKPGLLGIPCDDLHEGAMVLAEEAKRLGHPISDYILSPKSPKGVFIVAEHDERQREYLRYFKLGDGPYYVLLQCFLLCHLEIVKTIRRVLKGEGVLINNTGKPTISVAAIAKRPLSPGETIKRGIGSFDVRGSAIRIESDSRHIPIGLLANAVVRRKIVPGQRLSFDDVEIPDSLAHKAWLETQRNLQKT